MDNKLIQEKTKHEFEIIIEDLIANDMVEIASKYAEILAKETGFCVCICDRETVLAVAGATKSDYVAKAISDNVLNVIESREVWSTETDDVHPILDEEDVVKYKSEIIAPIICDAEAIGAVILFTKKINLAITEVEYKLVESTANFLGKHMEL